MLLHSRQGSGEHRPVDIKALVEESLNLAYHGARAEKQGFNITLERSFDPAAGKADLFPQEITRALLNLISNGFYAATKRKADATEGNYEPRLAAATKSLGDRASGICRRLCRPAGTWRRWPLRRHGARFLTQQCRGHNRTAARAGRAGGHRVLVVVDAFYRRRAPPPAPHSSGCATTKRAPAKPRRSAATRQDKKPRFRVDL